VRPTRPRQTSQCAHTNHTKHQALRQRLTSTRHRNPHRRFHRTRHSGRPDDACRWKCRFVKRNGISAIFRQRLGGTSRSPTTQFSLRLAAYPESQGDCPCWRRVLTAWSNIRRTTTKQRPAIRDGSEETRIADRAAYAHGRLRRPAMASQFGVRARQRRRCGGATYHDAGLQRFIGHLLIKLVAAQNRSAPRQSALAPDGRASVYAERDTVNVRLPAMSVSSSALWAADDHKEWRRATCTT